MFTQNCTVYAFLTCPLRAVCSVHITLNLVIVTVLDEKPAGLKKQKLTNWHRQNPRGCVPLREAKSAMFTEWYGLLLLFGHRSEVNWLSNVFGIINELKRAPIFKQFSSCWRTISGRALGRGGSAVIVPWDSVCRYHWRDTGTLFWLFCGVSCLKYWTRFTCANATTFHKLRTKWWQQVMRNVYLPLNRSSV